MENTSESLPWEVNMNGDDKFAEHVRTLEQQLQAGKNGKKRYSSDSSLTRRPRVARNLPVIITSVSLSWILLSVASFMCLTAAHLSPFWLLGSTRAATIAVTVPAMSDAYAPGWSVEKLKVEPSLGLWLRCSILGPPNNLRHHCGVYASNAPDIPLPQILSLAALVMGTVLAGLTCIATVLAACRRSVVSKSTFTLTGSFQALAGVCCVLGVTVFPLSWHSPRVHALCGTRASWYYPGDCTIGWALYVAITGTLGMLLCSILSIQADKSTSSGKVEVEMQKGNTLVCVV